MSFSFLLWLEDKIIIDSFTDNETGASVSFKVVDYKYPFSPKDNIRRIEFQNGESFLYSSVYLSEKRDIQPLYPCAQRMIDCFHKIYGGRNALVLGCAGCTIPRFLLHRYDDFSVTGVEYSNTVIDIANKYFISSKMKDRLTIINDDAFMYVKTSAQKYDHIFIDIFVEEKIHSSVFSDSFITDLYNCASDDSIIVFNLFGVGGAKAQRFMERISADFDARYVFEDYRKFFLALVKTKEPQKLALYEKRIRKYADIYSKQR